MAKTGATQLKNGLLNGNAHTIGELVPDNRLKSKDEILAIGARTRTRRR